MAELQPSQGYKRPCLKQVKASEWLEKQTKTNMEESKLWWQTWILGASLQPLWFNIKYWKSWVFRIKIEGKTHCKSRDFVLSGKSWGSFDIKVTLLLIRLGGTGSAECHVRSLWHLETKLRNRAERAVTVIAARTKNSKETELGEKVTIQWLSLLTSRLGSLRVTTQTAIPKILFQIKLALSVSLDQMHRKTPRSDVGK